MNRKLFAVVVITILFINLFVPFNVLAETGELTLSSSSKTIEIGSIVKVDLNINQIQDLFGFQFQLNYDTNYLEYESCIISNEYNSFDGMVVDSQHGKIFTPLIRKDLDDSMTKVNFTIASFKFKAKTSGKTNIILSETKLVSSETYINKFGQKDVKVISIPKVDDITLYVKESDSDSDTEPEPESNLEPTPESTPTPLQDDSKEDEKIDINKVQKQLQEDINNTFLLEPMKTKKVKKDNITYKHYAIYDLKNYDVVKNTEDDMVTLDKKIALSMYYEVPSSEEELLGLYRYDEEKEIWIYVKEAKQDKMNSRFIVEIDHFEKYAIMSYYKQYTDIERLYSEAQRAIKVLTAKHILQGVDQYRYEPVQPLTRAEFAKMLVNAINCPLENTNSIFIDVPAESWYATYIETAYKLGLVKGVGANRFEPESKITREEMAVMFERAYRYKGENTISDIDPFVDEQEISIWAKEAVAKMKSKGLLKGIGGNFFAPKREANRADAAVIILRFLEN